MYLLSSVDVFFDGLLKVDLWLLYRALKEFSVNPT